MSRAKAKSWPNPLASQGKVEVRDLLQVLLSVVLLLLVVWLYLIQATQAVSIEERIERLKARKMQLQQENALLRAQIAEEGCLSRVLKEAPALGFAPLKPTHYLVVAPLTSPYASSRDGWTLSRR